MSDASNVVPCLSEHPAMQPPDAVLGHVGRQSSCTGRVEAPLCPCCVLRAWRAPFFLVIARSKQGRTLISSADHMSITLSAYLAGKVCVCLRGLTSPAGASQL
jgi:hypothetical protein